MSFLIHHWKMIRLTLIVALVITVAAGSVRGYVAHRDWGLSTILFVFSAVTFAIFYLFAKTIPAIAGMWHRTFIPGLSATFFPRMFFIYGFVALVLIAVENEITAEGIGIPLSAIVGMLCTLGNFLHEDAQKSVTTENRRISSPATPQPEHQQPDRQQ